MRIGVIGTGYVGLTTGVCLADIGHQVVCVDKDAAKMDLLARGGCPIHEPGLNELILKNIQQKRIVFSSDIKQVLTSEVIFICVGTPGREDGSVDLSALDEVLLFLEKRIDKRKILVLKSTVPVGTNRRVAKRLKKCLGKKAGIVVLNNPEFLRQGKAIADTMKPDRIIIGGEDKAAIAVLKAVYEKIPAPVLVTSPEDAEIIKYAANSFLAMKISYINEIARVCELYQADVKQVAMGMGLDPRIGGRFLEAGIGFGGSCFPKDMRALVCAAKNAGYDFCLLEAALKVNEKQKTIAFEKIKKYYKQFRGKQIGLLGLTFKPDTDDIREAPSIALIRRLLEEGVVVKVHDPKGEANMRKLFKEVSYCKSPYEVARKSDAIVLLTEWAEYKKMSFAKIKKIMRKPIFIDGRNLFDPKEMKKMGFLYEGIGR